MSRRIDMTSTGHEIEINTYKLYLDVKMHIDEIGETNTVVIDRIKVTRVFNRAKYEYIDRVYQYPFSSKMDLMNS